jgi:hypothetical protein
MYAVIGRRFRNSIDTPARGSMRFFTEDRAQPAEGLPASLPARHFVGGTFFQRRNARLKAL